MVESKIHIPGEKIERSILLVRGHKVMLDSDLAELYRVEPRVLTQAVKRNIGRFPGDFMFQLTDEEYHPLRSQFVILKGGRGQHRKYLPSPGHRMWFFDSSTSTRGSSKVVGKERPTKKCSVPPSRGHRCPKATARQVAAWRLLISDVEPSDIVPL